jgi:hypothetical protein
MPATQVARPNPSTRRKRLYVALPTDEFRDLKAVADRESRSPDQQAAHVLRRWLRQLAATSAGCGGTDDATAG